MAATAVGGNTADPATLPTASTQIELSVSCRNLVNKDTFSNSDPMCVVGLCEFGKTTYTEIERTEVIKDNLNPEFVKKILLSYYFEEVQKLRFTLYDVDSSSANLSHHDYLGHMECTLGDIVCRGSLTKPLLDKKSHESKNLGLITVRAEEVGACSDVITLKLSGSRLDKKDFFGKSDPFLIFYKCNDDMSFTAVHRTEFCKKTLNPQWKEFTIPVRQLCNGDLERNIKVECLDWDRNGGHDLIGVFLTNTKELTCQKSPFDLINPKKKAHKKGYKNSGFINIQRAEITKQFGFLEYVKAGVQINFTVAIDFTQSNGDPAKPESLHHIDNYGLNQYANTLLAVGSVIQDYDSDKQFPALGFGGLLPDGTVSHEFFLNGNPSNPFCSGIDGVMNAYQSAIRSVRLYYPTNFAPVINHVARFASAIRDGSNYFILLIITDGIITDMRQTKEAIIRASCLPMSIIIVGVGTADFSAMEELDGDRFPLSLNGQAAARDIVQFVPMRDFLATGDPSMIQARLAKAVLAEIPDQFLLYMRRNGISPLSSKLPVGQQMGRSIVAER